MQQLEAFRVQYGRCPAHASKIAARVIEAGDEATLDRIATGFEYYRNRGCRLFGRQRRCASTIGEDHVYLASGQIGGQLRQPVIVARSITVFNRDIAAFGEAAFIQSSDKGRSYRCRRVGGVEAGEKADRPYGRTLLCIRCKRPSGRYSAK